MSSTVPGEVLLRIANGIAALMHECFGRGPARVRAEVLAERYLVVVLEGGLIDAERTLVNHGRADLVRVFRLAFEEAVRDRMTQLVERELGRKVLGYAGQVLTATDTQLEVFDVGPGATA